MSEEREMETNDEIRNEDYANDDEIEMERNENKEIEDLRKTVDEMNGKLNSIFDSISMFVDSGAVIRENDFMNENITKGDDLGVDFQTIEELDWSL